MVFHHTIRYKSGHDELLALLDQEEMGVAYPLQPLTRNAHVTLDISLTAEPICR